MKVRPALSSWVVRSDLIISSASNPLRLPDDSLNKPIINQYLRISNKVRGFCIVLNNGTLCSALNAAYYHRTKFC